MISAALISISIAAIFFSPHWLFFLVIEIFILIGLNEFFSLAEAKGLIIHRGFGLFFGVLLPLTAYGSFQLPVILMTCIALFIFLFNRTSPDRTISSVSVSVFGIIYIAWFFSYLNKLHLLNNGASWVFYTILTVKAGDSGAYFIGTKFGKTKLLQHVSPNKSVEGCLGQIITTFVLSLLSSVYLDVPLVHLAILGAVIGPLAVLGDLAESLIKRDAGIKDSGNIPGLGGILDVIDSLLFTVPFVYFYLTVILGLEKL